MKNNAKKTNTVTTVELTPSEFKEIPLNRIRLLKSQPRKFFDEKSLEELSRSIKSTGGVIQPILVRSCQEDENGTIFELVAGERRLRASVLAEMPTISATIRLIKDEDILEVQVIENLHRKDITPLEEAHSYRAFLDLKTKRITVKEIALRISKSEVYVYNRLQLLNLIEPAQELLQSEILPLTHALEICKLTPELQEKVIKQVISYSYHGEDKGKPVGCATLAKTRAAIKDHLSLNLKDAIFDTKDKNLCPLAGSCTGCVKRTGFNKTLFNDLVEDDRCMDDTCFENKQNAHLKALIVSNTKGKSVPLVISDYYSDGESEELEVKYLGSRSWISLEDAKEKFEGEIPKKLIHKGISIADNNLGEIIDVLKTKDLDKLINPDLAQEEEDDDQSDSNFYNRNNNQYQQERDVKKQYMVKFIQKYAAGNYQEEFLKEVLIERISECLENSANNTIEILAEKYNILIDEQKGDDCTEDAFRRISLTFSVPELSLLSKEFAALDFLSNLQLQGIIDESANNSIELEYPEGFVIPEPSPEAQDDEIENQDDDTDTENTLIEQQQETSVIHLLSESNDHFDQTQLDEAI